MRSSVVESQPLPRFGDRGASYTIPRMPNPQRQNSQPVAQYQKRQVVLAPVEGWLPLLLLAVAMYSVVYSIISANWVSHTFILIWSTAVGLLIGLLVAKVRLFPQAILHLAACLIGHWLSIWLTSAVAFHIPWTLVIKELGTVIVNPGRIDNGEMVFLFYLSFLCFFLGYFGTWLTYRAHLPWLVALVYCSILLVNLNYVKQDLTLVAIILMAALVLLIARIQLVTQLVQWTSEGLYADRSWLRDLTRRFMRVASIFTLLALLVSWALPILDQPDAGMTFWDRVDNIWSNISHGHVSWQDPGSIALPYQPPTNFFGDQLTIAGSVTLPTGEVLYYTSTAAPQYLAGFTYDSFDGHTWTTVISNTPQNYDAHASIQENDLEAGSYVPATTNVTIVQPPESSKHYIFAPVQPARFDVATTVYGSGIPTAWAQQHPLTRGEHYQVTSFLPTAAAQDLASVPLPSDNADLWKGDTNSAALQTYYLQTPNDLSPNVWKTVQQWTLGATNTYNALKLLEAHLSNSLQFTYSLNNPPVPDNIDAVDWLLQAHRGYCTYYATAMTIMARLLGIPARVVNGFSQGHLDTQSHMWVVDGTDAHSWVQAYFPGYGWVNFDPTPGFSLDASPPGPQPTVSPTPVPTRTAARPSPTAAAPGKKPGSHTGQQSDPRADAAAPDAMANQNLLLGLSISALLCSLLVLFIAIWTYWWRNLYANSTLVSGMFWRVCRIASWMGFSPRESQTPYEYSRTLSRYFPQETAPLRHLTELFVRDRWAAPHQAVAKEADLERLRPSLRRMFLRLLIKRARKSN